MIKVLIAEDNAVNRELLRELLEVRGYSVIEAGNGQEALQKLAETQPDILLLDLDMPVLDGFGALRAIRKLPHLATLPVMAVTAYAMQGDREEILKLGFDAYLSKPIVSGLLWQEIERLLGQKSSPGASARAADAP